MKTTSDSKFALNDLHQEIDFLDRKIAYCQTFEQFDSPDERDSALRKLATKRGSLRWRWPNVASSAIPSICLAHLSRRQHRGMARNDQQQLSGRWQWESDVRV